MDANKLVAAYIKMRDAKDALTREYDAKINEIKEQMELVEQSLLEICKSTGQDGGRTPPSEVASALVSDPLDHDGDGKKGGSRKGRLATARKR